MGLSKEERDRLLSGLGALFDSVTDDDDDEDDDEVAEVIGDAHAEGAQLGAAAVVAGAQLAADLDATEAPPDPTELAVADAIRAEASAAGTVAVIAAEAEADIAREEARRETEVALAELHASPPDPPPDAEPRPAHRWTRPLGRKS